MILLDGIFIIELFLRKREKEKDYIFSKPWLAIGTQHDLILLENQLPFFVLEDLYTSAFYDSSCLSHHQEHETPFLKLSHRYFFPYDKQQESNIGGEVKHFTDFLRYLFCSPRLKPTGSWHHLCSATELDEAGLKFKAAEKRRLLDITFPVNKCLKCCLCFNLSWLLACLPCLEGMERFLEVPRFAVGDRTECLLRNLMALEQCHYPFNAYIYNYVVLLDYLIDTEKDVALLIDKKVNVNELGSNAAVAALINNLCIEVVVVGSCYSALYQEINGYRDNPWNRILATLTSVYFRNFWRGTTTVVGLVVMGFTFWNFLRPFVVHVVKLNNL